MVPPISAPAVSYMGLLRRRCQLRVIEDGLPTDLSTGALAKAEALVKPKTAQMSAKLNKMGEQVYVEAEKVKESNRLL
jgi:hypothetical protein